MAIIKISSRQGRKCFCLFLGAYKTAVDFFWPVLFRKARVSITACFKAKFNSTTKVITKSIKYVDRNGVLNPKSLSIDEHKWFNLGKRRVKQ